MIWDTLYLVKTDDKAKEAFTLPIPDITNNWLLYWYREKGVSWIIWNFSIMSFASSCLAIIYKIRIFYKPHPF